MGSKPSRPMPAALVATNELRMQEGRMFLSIVWQNLAEKVVERAIAVYGLDAKQAAALRVAFLQRIVYGVEAL